MPSAAPLPPLFSAPSDGVAAGHGAREPLLPLRAASAAHQHPSEPRDSSAVDWGRATLKLAVFLLSVPALCLLPHLHRHQPWAPIQAWAGAATLTTTSAPAASRAAPDGRAFSSRCILALSGGAVGLGGSFPHYNATDCIDQLKAYFDGQYLLDVEIVASAAISYFEGIAAQRAQQQQQQQGGPLSPLSREVVVFDIDETALSNRAGFFPSHSARPGGVAAAAAADGASGVEAAHQEGQQQGAQPWGPALTGHPFKGLGGMSPAVVTAAANVASADAASDSAGVLRWDPSAFSPPLGPVLGFYLRLQQLGFSVAFITGRKERARDFTAANLAAAGYGDRCGTASAASAVAAPGSGQVAAVAGMPGGGGGAGLESGGAAAHAAACYVELLLRDNDDDRLASVFKPDRRAQLKAQGWEVVGNIGDQFSDLEGTSSAPGSFKLPNPQYYIL